MRSLLLSGVVKIEIIESAATLKKLLKNARTPQQKERIQAIYWLKNNTVETVKQVALMLGRNPVTVQKWLKKYREGGIDRLLEKKKKSPGRPTLIPSKIIEKLKEELKEPEGFESYGEIQLWLKSCFDIDVAYRTVHELVRYKLKAKLKVASPVQIKQQENAVKQFKKNSHLN